MPNVLFITPGPLEFASARLRGYWIAEHIDGAEVQEFRQIDENKTISPAFQHYIFIKVINSDYAKQLHGMGKKVWWDLCDPVHWFQPELAREATENIDGIVFSNTELRLDFQAWYGRDDLPMLTIPDRLKLEHYKRYHVHQETPKPRLIWFGAAQNRISIHAALANLARLEANGVVPSVTIYDDNPREVWRISKGIPTYHGEWTLDTENEVISDHDIALLPPYPGPWGNVKSNNKKLTAWACGLPVADGLNYQHLYRLCTELEYRHTSAELGYKTLIAKYDVRQSAQEWKDLLCLTTA